MLLEIIIGIELLTFPYVHANYNFESVKNNEPPFMDYQANEDYGKLTAFDPAYDDEELLEKPQAFMFPPKRSHLQNLISNFPSEFQSMETNKGIIVPSYSSLKQNGCSCELKMDILKLGRDYYPRYLRTGKCTSNSCIGSHSCKEIVYKVKVLRAKDSQKTEAGDREQGNMPHSLKKSWTLESIDTVVACQCI